MSANEAACAVSYTWNTTARNSIIHGRQVDATVKHMKVVLKYLGYHFGLSTLRLSPVDLYICTSCFVQRPVVLNINTPFILSINYLFVPVH